MAGLGEALGGASQTGEPQSQDTVKLSSSGGASQTGEPQSQSSALPVVDPANASPRRPNERSMEMVSDDVEDSELEDPTPEQQAAYTELEENCLKVIFPEGDDDAPAATIVQSLKASDDPVLNLASTVVAVLKGVLDSAARAKHPVDPEIIMPVGVRVLELLGDLMEGAGIHDFNEEELEQAALQATDLFRTQATASGLIDGEAAKAEFGQVVEADKAGTLGQLVPGIGKRLTAAEG